jgi:hypothetical protein
MDSARAKAEQSVDAILGDSLGCIVISASPMRPGRGRRDSHWKSRRRETLKGQERFEETVASVTTGVCSGSLSPEQARNLIHETGLDEYIRIAESREQVVKAFADSYGLGYYLWAVNEEPIGGQAKLLRVDFATRKEMT